MDKTSFSISNETNEVTVDDSAVSDGYVKVTFNGSDSYVFDTSINQTPTANDGEYRIRYSDGTVIENSETKFQITLGHGCDRYNGTKIYRDPIKKYVKYPDGSKIQSETESIPDEGNIIELIKPSYGYYIGLAIGMLLEAPLFIFLLVTFYLIEHGYALLYYAKYKYSMDKTESTEIDQIRREYQDGEITFDELEERLESQLVSEDSQTTTTQKSLNYN